MTLPYDSMVSFPFSLYSDVELGKHKHSIIAAACLGCARRVLRVSPIWSDHLRKITTYALDQIEPCIERIWTVYSDIFLNKTLPS